MYLKEAFRYQNYLNSLIDRAVSYLTQSQYVTKTKQEHMRKKANPEAEDETIDVVASRPIDFTANELVSFLEHVVVSKDELTQAISAAKKNATVDIDAAIANNRIRQKISNVLTNMGNMRASERMVKAYGYKFNTVGDQVQYTYDVKEVTTIDFDRNKVKSLGKRLIEEADKVSAQVDKLMVELNVEYSPEFSVNDSFEDAVAQFLGK